MAMIGPTFAQELLAAGCAQNVSWTSDGTLTIDPSMPANYVQRVQAVLAVHNPNKPLLSTLYTFDAFMGLFTSDEQTAIMNCVATPVRMGLVMLAGASPFDITTSGPISFVNNLVTALVITQARASVILGSAH